MFIITDLAAVQKAFDDKAPRPIRDVLLEIYPGATIDCNNRAHAPYEGYECQLTGKTFSAGEYLPMSEGSDDDNYAGGPARRFPEGADLHGKVHSWDGRRGQNIAVWGELIAQSKAYDASRSNYIGEVGGKVTTEVTVAFVKGFTGVYGTTWIHIMKDAFGNVIVYKGSKYLGNKDANIKLSGKVKFHSERDKVKQTTIERPKVL